MRPPLSKEAPHTWKSYEFRYNQIRLESKYIKRSFVERSQVILDPQKFMAHLKRLKQRENIYQDESRLVFLSLFQLEMKTFQTDERFMYDVTSMQKYYFIIPSSPLISLDSFHIQDVDHYGIRLCLTMIKSSQTTQT